MTLRKVTGLLLGSAVISSIVLSVIGGVFSIRLTHPRWRESRFAVAAELTRLNQDLYIEAGRQLAGSEVSLQDPAQVMRFYIAERDATAGNRYALKAEWTQKVSYKGPRMA